MSRTYRAKGIRLAALGFGLWCLLILLPGSLGDAPSTADAVLSVVVFGGLGGFYCLRLAFVEVRADAEGIRIRNPVRTHRVRWQDIQRFHYGRKGLLLKGLADLTDGTTLGMFAIPLAPAAPERSSGYRMVEELGARLRRVKLGEPWDAEARTLD